MSNYFHRALSIFHYSYVFDNNILSILLFLHTRLNVLLLFLEYHLIFYHIQEHDYQKKKYQFQMTSLSNIKYIHHQFPYCLFSPTHYINFLLLLNLLYIYSYNLIELQSKIIFELNLAYPDKLYIDIAILLQSHLDIFR